VSDNFYTGTPTFRREEFAALYSLVFLLIPPADAFTKYTNKPGSCQIEGDADVYGLGIRLGFYLQWAAVMLGTWIAQDQVEMARIASNIVTVAVCTNMFRGVSHGALIAADWWIVCSMTFVLTIGYIPVRPILLKTPTSSLVFLSLLWSMITVAECWVWFKGVDIGHREGCTVKIFVVFLKVNVYNTTLRTIFKVKSVLANIIGAIFVIRLVCKWLGSVVRFRIEGTEGGSSKPKAYGYMLEAGLTVFQLIFGVFAILQIELTIKINNISVSAPITSSGQLIPLVAGVFTLAATFAVLFERMYRHCILQRFRSAAFEDLLSNSYTLGRSF
jgi:hypothetical protein